MRCVIVGYGVQGKKRWKVAGREGVGIVDPIHADAHWQDIREVPLEQYDAAVVCTPDEPKQDILGYLAQHGKHVLVEKPLHTANEAELAKLQKMARATGALIYTAYNHRFEPHLVRLKEIIDGGLLGELYLARGFYGNGTARDVRQSPWRDRDLGVLSDLGSHLLDLCLFLFGPPASEPVVWGYHCFENAAADHVLFGFDGHPVLQLEATLLSWRNSFAFDVYGERGSAHVQGLCKWGPSTLTMRTRVLPSGRPHEDTATLEQSDPTWAAEYRHFKRLCETGGTNIDNDRWIDGILGQMRRAVRVEASTTTALESADRRLRGGVTP